MLSFGSGYLQLVNLEVSYVVLSINIWRFKRLNWNWGTRDFVKLWDKMKSCRWVFICVYGPTYEDLKDHFLAELSISCNSVDVPYIVGGDFNILRHVIEKINLLCFLTPLRCLIMVFIHLPLETFSCSGAFIPSLSIEQTLLWKNLIECWCLAIGRISSSW
jgi:hypothetical protein